MNRRKTTIFVGWALVAWGLPLSGWAQSGDSEDAGDLPTPEEVVGESEPGDTDAGDSGESGELPTPGEVVGDSESGESDAKEGGERSEAGGSAHKALPPKELGGDGADGDSGDEQANSTDDSTGTSGMDEPPVQVRRSVDQVVGSAKEVASGIAGDEATADSDGAEEAAPSDARKESTETAGADDEPAFRRLERRSDGQGGADDQNVTGHLDDLMVATRELLDQKPTHTLELAPYVDDPRWREAMQLLVDDECRDAIDLVDTLFDEVEAEREEKWRSTPAVQYAVARIKMCAGQSGEGRETLRKLAGRDDAVGELAARRLGESPAPIDGVDRSPGFTQKLAAAKKLVRSDGLDEALGMLDKLHRNAEQAWQRYKARMAEADLLLGHGRMAEAARTFFGIYEMTRDWKIGDRVANRIEQVERQLDVQILGLAARVDRMRELISRGRYSKARKVSVQNAKIAGVSGDEIEGWSAYRKGLQAERKRRRERADELFEKAEKLTESPVIRPRIYFGWARALRRLDRDDEAIELYERLCREYPRNRLCDDATYEAGRLYQYHGNHEQARARFVDVVGMHPNSEHVPDSLWRGALSTYQLGEYEKVDAPLERLINEYGEETDPSGLPLGLKARYWRGAAAFKRGDMELARRRLQATINRGALTWYGTLAAARLRKLGEQPVLPVPSSNLSRRRVRNLATLEIPDNDRLSVAAEYARLRLYGDAADEIKRQINAGAPPDNARRFLGTVMLLDGDVPEAHWMMQNYIDLSAPTYFTLRDWGIAYPLAFMEHAHKWGHKYDVSPFLVEGIMRQESAFRAEVSSYVGAVGLMQLMPGTANWLSDNLLDGHHLSRRELVDPETNVQLGTLYVRLLLEMTDHNIPMSLAGYNAGPAPLESWFKRFGDSEIDAWVELITYRQARAYVRKVYTSYVRYSSLYGGGYPELSLELPDDIQDWGQVDERLKFEESEAVSWNLEP